MIWAAKKGWKHTQEGLPGNPNGGKEQPFRSGLGKVPGPCRAACAKAGRQGRELSWFRELKKPRTREEEKERRGQ